MPKIWNGYYLTPFAVVLVGTLVAIFWIPLRQERAEEERIHQAYLPVQSGASKLLSLWYALDGFASAHQGRIPKSDRWQDDLKPYWTERESSLESDLICAPEGAGLPATGIAFNKRFSGWPLSKLQSFEKAAVFHEVPLIGRNLLFDPTDFENRPGPRFQYGRRGWLRVMASGSIRGIPTRA